MKKHLFIIALVLAALAAAPRSAGAVESRLGSVFTKIKGLVHQDIPRWDMSDTLTKEEMLDPNLKKKFKKVGIGYFWGSGPTKIWLRAKYKVPEQVLNQKIAGSRISLGVNLEDRGEIYVNGELKQSFHRSSGFVTLTENAMPGEEYFIVISAERKDNDTGLLRDITLKYSVLEELERRISGINESIGALDTLLAMSGETPEKWQPKLNEAADSIDLDALQSGRIDDFYASLKKCTDTLAPLTTLIKKYSMLMIAYSHIDPAWLWDKKEGEHVVWKGTSEEVLALMKEFPRFVYVANQMHCYRWMEKDYPDLFKRIQEKVKTGQWEPVGAEWVEPDGNIPSGESYVRQFFYGRKYSKEKFNFVSTIGWTPDSFGYNWNMPQILAKSDMRGFVTQKISWNDTTRFPHNLFWWKAPDGSKTLVYFPQGGYGESVHGNTMANQLSNIKAKHGVDSNLVIFGVGDHGGGIPRDYMERAFSLAADPLYPKMEFISPEKVFDRMFAADKIKKFPTWDTELYLEYHRGTYTTQAKTKNNNRRNEIRILNSERFNSIAASSAGAKYPFDKIEEAWKILLFNQFHDILPGSSITPVYMDADKDHLWISKQTAEATNSALESIAALADTTGPGTPLVLFNGLSWTRDDLAEVPLSEGITDAAIYDPSGKEIPSQIIDKGDNKKSVIFVAKKVPAMGYAVYSIKEGTMSTTAGAVPTVKSGEMENEFFKVTVDPKSGWVTSIFDKKNNKEIVEPGKAAFQLQAYQERPDSDAWDPRFVADANGVKPPASALLEMPDAGVVQITELGPVRVTISAERKFTPKSGFRSYYSLVSGMPVIYGRLDAKWHEANVFLKSAFNLNLDADHATFEIPYAAIERVTKPKTPGELAKWEMSGHRWVDYTGNDKKYGVTLLSFSKYGYDVKQNVLRMSMLRAPTGPDPIADRGNHSIPYALYPHIGDWTSADSPLRGAEYNDPLIVLKTTAHKGKFGKTRSFFTAGPHNVVLNTVKRSEDGKGFILRLVETSGKDGAATITLPRAPKTVTETNLVERELKKLPTPKSNTITVPIGHFEIKTIKVVF